MKEGTTGVILVFASNLAGVHGNGSALHARLYKGAVYGRGVGRQGNSYAIPTKDWDIYTPLPIDRIKGFVDDFVLYAKAHPELKFKIVAIGTGNAGYTDAQMAPLFKDVPGNCILTGSWRRIIKGLKESGAGQDPDGVPSVQQA